MVKVTELITETKTALSEQVELLRQNGICEAQAAACRENIMVLIHVLKNLQDLKLQLIES